MTDLNTQSDSWAAELARLARLTAARAADGARADQDRRWRAGERPLAEEYLAALPAVAADPEHTLALVSGEVLARVARGETPAEAEYRARFPALAGRLAAEFARHAGAPADTAPPPAAGADDATVNVSALRAAAADFSVGQPGAAAVFGPAHEPGDLGTMGHYRVLRLLGRGGMGAVFEAEDTRLDRPVALKVMLPDIARNATAHARFLREAKAAAKVKHDHVVTIYQVDEHRGVPFLAMELLDGSPLDAWLKANKNPPMREVCRIGREAAEGLAAAHARGLVHRDIKPANLWVEAPGGRVKILDFGLARPTRRRT